MSLQYFLPKEYGTDRISATRIGRYRHVVGSLLSSCASGLAGAVVLCLAVGAGTLAAQGSPSPAPQAAHTAATPTRVFASDAGLVLNFIKPDKTADFEHVVATLREALHKSAKPERAAQAASWRVFRVAEPAANGAILYVFVIDPAVKGADYTVSTILGEAFPDEVRTLYQQYAGAYASGQNIVNLTRLGAFAPASPIVK